jgi:hypothetical protein
VRSDFPRRKARAKRSRGRKNKTKNEKARATREVKKYGASTQFPCQYGKTFPEKASGVTSGMK